jgi:hypothetical protein
MTIALSLLALAELESLLDDPRHVGRIPVVPEALPPQFILEAAVKALRERKPPIWFSPFAFIQSSPTQAAGTGGSRATPQAGALKSDMASLKPAEVEVSRPRQ